MIRYHIFAFGKVQQVGFRYFVYSIATELSLTGWVKNCEDGSVELEVQGKQAIVDKFVERIKKGNRFARVSQLNIDFIDVNSREESFIITD